MNKLETLKWNFLYELNELNQLSHGGQFKIGLMCEDGSPKDYKCDYIDSLKKQGAIEIIDEYFGRAAMSNGKKANLSAGVPLRIFGYKPIEMTVRVNMPYFGREFDNQQDIIESNGKNLIQCFYDDKKQIANLVINRKKIPIKKTRGLIAYYLYVTRKFSNSQDFKTYNKFIEEEKYSDKNITGFTAFRHSIEAINKRVKKEGEKYVTSVIDKIEGDSKRSEYKWNPKFSKK